MGGGGSEGNQVTQVYLEKPPLNGTCNIYIFIDQTGRKINKTNKYSNFKKNNEHLTTRT